MTEQTLVLCKPDAVARGLVGEIIRRIEVYDTVAEAVSSALLSTPPDGEIVITGSLYFVGAARSMLVDK